VDIPNALVQTRVDNEKVMAFVNILKIMVDILGEIAPDVYKPYVTKEKKGTKKLLVQCQNTLYITMVQKFVKSLTDIYFVINLYNPCVANKRI
jgi:hypothetical protein